MYTAITVYLVNEISLYVVYSWNRMRFNLCFPNVDTLRITINTKKLASSQLAVFSEAVFLAWIFVVLWKVHKIATSQEN